jgi:hypothetical protein
MKRFLWLGFVLFLYVMCAACGETFRPIIIPNPPTFPNPAAAHTVVSINDNGTVVPGSAMVIDVSGNTDVSVADVGLAPVYAVQQSASGILVVNHSVTGAAADSLTRLNFSGTAIGTTTTISLPPNSGPNFVAVAPSATTAYVTLPNYAPPSVGVVSTLSGAMVNTITVGNNPDAIGVTPDNSKLYVANQGSSSISAFNTLDRSPRTINGSFNAPLWLIARSDSQRLYVLNGTTGSPQDGVVSTIDTTSTAGPDNVIDASVSAPGAAYMLYDGNLNRLYIPGGSQLTILDVSQSTPVVLAGGPIAIPPVLPSARTQGDVCSTFSPGAVTAAAVAALPDGSRAYVGSYAEFQVNVTITGAALTSSGASTTTYNYTLSPGTPDLLPGMVITISNVDSTGLNPSNNPPSDFDGTFTILSAGGGAFAVTNAPTDNYISGGTGAAPNMCPQVTVIDTTSNTIETPSIAIPGFPAYDSFCSTTRFRFMMAAGGDSSRAYLSSCDGGNVNIIDTSSETYILNLAAPVSSRPPIPPNPQNPPQNPVFLIAGP